MNWTETIWTYYYHYTVIEITPDGEEVTVETYDETRDEFEVTAPIIENFPEHVPGDREITTTFTNVRERGQLIVTKRDANTGQTLAGAQVHVKGVDLGNAGTYDRTATTGADGRAVFDGLFPGTYSIQEIQAPFGYNLNDQVQAVTIQSNETVYREIHNTRKAGLFIKKVDQNGQPIAGATFELRRGSGEVLMREVTDLNGIIYRGYLTTDTYIIEEIKAPEGYLLDENNPQSIYISNTDDNKEFVVTFVNKKKPAIEIEKVDGTTPTLKLEGAVFRITDTRTGIYWDIQTGKDGKALLESLEINTTYMVEEIEAPEGYVNTGYREEIVLKESRVHTLTISNEQKPSIKIIKKDAETGGFLMGATFRLAKEGGSSFQDVTTDRYGEVLVTDLTPGTYILTEIKAPSGYILGSTPQTVIIKQGEHTVVEVTNHQKSTLTLIKKDALSGKALEGAIFRFAKDGGSNYQDVTTGKDGIVKIGDIEPGTYTLTEIKAPNGYLINDEPVTVIITNGEHKIIELVNYKRPSLEIVKKDKMTGELLADATFRVSWNNGADFRDVTTEKNGKAIVTDLNDGWYTITEIRAPEGYLLNEEPQQVLLKPGEAGVIEIFNEAKPSLTLLKVDSVTKTPLQYARFRIERKTDESTTLIGEYVSDEDGIVFLDNILPGRYLITEIEAPDGFNIDRETHEVTIEYGKPYKLEITNTAKSPIYIQKVDDKGNPLMGAKFVVKTMNGAMVGTVTSGRTGYAIIPYAEPGWYIVEEVQAPDGYILSANPVNVEVKSGRPAQVEFVNHKKPQLTILKLDKSDNTALMGARIKVARTNGEIIGTFTSGVNGLVILTDLEPGSYTVTEIAAPDGFILDTTPQIVELKAGESKQIELYNTAKPGLQLRKIDKLTNLPVKGAVFSLTRLDNGGKYDLGSYTTGENGLFFVPDLTPGNYVLTEITAPAGYILDSTPQNIYIEGGKLNTVTVYNVPYSGLRIVKIDSDTRAPLENAVFKLFDERRLEIGTYTTTALGEIMIPELPAGTYYLQEVKAPAGYILDNTVQKVELIGGKTTVVEVKNKELGSLRIIKRSKEDRKPLYGASFLLYDSKNNLLGEFTTDQNGLIVFGKNLSAGTYKIKEIKAPDGFVLDEIVRTVTVKEGETTEIVIENEPKRGRIQITKVASDYNEITKDKENAALKNAIFKIYDNKMNLVDTIETEGRNGIATSKQLPLGVYGIKEVSSPDYYITDGEMFYAEIKVHDDLVKFKVLNKPVELETSVEKRGIAETQAGASIVYDLSNIKNGSNVELSEFYIRDVLPTEAVRLEKFWTGVWSERVKLEVQIRTNLKTGFRTVKKDLLSTNNNEIDCSPSALGLASNEYVVEFRILFKDDVQPGFHETTGPKVQVKVLDTVQNGQKFTNKVDVGGKYLREYIYSTDGWTCTVFTKPRGDLPKTGW